MKVKRILSVYLIRSIEIVQPPLLSAPSFCTLQLHVNLFVICARIFLFGESLIRLAFKRPSSFAGRCYLLQNMSIDFLFPAFALLLCWHCTQYANNRNWQKPILLSQNIANRATCSLYVLLVYCNWLVVHDFRYAPYGHVSYIHMSRTYTMFNVIFLSKGIYTHHLIDHCTESIIDTKQQLVNHFTVDNWYTFCCFLAIINTFFWSNDDDLVTWARLPFFALCFKWHFALFSFIVDISVVFHFIDIVQICSPVLSTPL